MLPLLQRMTPLLLVLLWFSLFASLLSLLLLSPDSAEITDDVAVVAIIAGAIDVVVDIVVVDDANSTVGGEVITLPGFFIKQQHKQIG